MSKLKIQTNEFDKITTFRAEVQAYGQRSLSEITSDILSETLPEIERINGTIRNPLQIDGVMEGASEVACPF